MKTIVAICGSLRPGSSNHHLLRAAAESAPNQTDIHWINWKEIPIFDDMTPANKEILEIAEEINKADAVMIASPEYNWSIPGGLKNLLDWLSRVGFNPFENKPTLIMGTSPGKLGTARMQPHLRQVMGHFKAKLIDEPEVAIGNSAQVFNKDGDLIDPNASKLVSQAVSNLIAATN
ncbi:MAG: NAD(P)H-dependent oxidoreductase [Actinobacteria bacterium]|nr:NAD(P)H-dependent oxidoreductase [Actinomycetota bacterium]